MTAIDLSVLTAAHTERLIKADRLLPVAGVPRSDENDELIEVALDDTVAVGVAQLIELDPDSMAATWGALRQHRLTIRFAGPAQERVVDRLLTEWDEHLARTARPGDPDTAAVITWPARDTVPITALVRHGFTAAVGCAVRPGRPTTGGAGRPRAADVRVRPATTADLDVATGFHVGVVDHDAQFGLVTRRPSTPGRLRESVVETLTRERTGVWLAERSGEPVGLLALEFPPDTDWIAGLVAAGPIGYVGCLYVRPDARGAGIGTTLVAEGDRALAEAGAEVTLLHHALPNPRSTPFWYAHGYRPLWTTWQRRPVFR